MTQQIPGALERAWINLSRVWRRIGLASPAVPGRGRPGLPGAELEALRVQIEECLAGKGGEVSSRARAAAIGNVYLTLDDTGRRRYLGLLASGFGVDRKALAREIAMASQAADTRGQIAFEDRLRKILTPRHMKLLTRFNSLPSGVKFLVDLRADVLRLAGDDPGLAGLGRDLRRLLASWFDVGFLDLERITWDSPAALLERLIAYEAVHEIRSWDDMKRRLEDDRRCYAFFHPRMPGEPLIFVEVALVGDMSGSIQGLLDDGSLDRDAETARTAVFYSISNTQAGLHGVHLGDFLIKRVVDLLKAELPNLGTFVTLSPIPDFGGWARERLESRSGERLPRPGWHTEPAARKALEAPLMRLSAEYLLDERHNGRAPDRVAHFHLTNGARIARINWLADTSERGLAESFGMMVNYEYRLEEIEANHERYTSTGEAAVSAPVLELRAAAGSGTANRDGRA
jgi:malonyl-CoA decarboxylase